LEPIRIEPQKDTVPQEMGPVLEQMGPSASAVEIGPPKSAIAVCQ